VEASHVFRVVLVTFGSFLLWSAGTIFFDLVHWILHALLRSRWRLVRSLAWPHTVHHRWLDDRLVIHRELQSRNVVCHLMPEYLTQAVFCAAALVILPGSVVGGCFALQTAVFIGLLNYRGLDVNHRPIEILDAHRPCAFALPAYHALHHVHPDSYFSACCKLVDLIVGGGCALAGRRVYLVGGPDPLCEKLSLAVRCLLAAAVNANVERWIDEHGDEDILVLLPAAPPGSAAVERFLAARVACQLPPEVWDLRAAVDAAAIRFYQRDPRVIYRHAPPPRLDNGARCDAFARRSVFWFTRGLHFVPATWKRAPAEWWRFHRTALAPGASTFIRSRKEGALAHRLSAIEKHPDAMPRPQGDRRVGGDSPSRRRPQPKTPQGHRHDEARLDQGKLLPDADSRSPSERKVSEA
jgi:hypothetical protein